MNTIVRNILVSLPAVLLLLFWQVVAAEAGNVDGGSFKVIPFEFDPGKTHLVSAEWEEGVGCPTNATAFIDDPTTPSDYDPIPTPYADPTCVTGDSKDKLVEGLVLVKTGPTPNFASAGADLKGVKGIALSELGYDIRKINAPPDAQGSHCGAGAPRFDVVSGGVTYFIGCNSPTATSTTAGGNGWVRLKWGDGGSIPAYGPAGLTNIFSFVVESISIVFDEGQDASGGPDQFGLAVLDNINVNGKLVGRGFSDGKDKDSKDRPGKNWYGKKKFYGKDR
ncbi:MAG TPA: hypothetical protein VK466_01255 [Terriglobales bacterium]|nr:hypothetical protein [Terriglobales bacterium]